MPIPSSMSDLSVTAVTCSPPGGEFVGTNVDDYVRGISAIIRRESARGAEATVVSGVLTPGNDGSYFTVSSNSAISGIANSWVGRQATFTFLSSQIITHSVNLLLPSSLNITTVAGRVIRFVQEATSPVIWRFLSSDAGGGTGGTGATGPAGPAGPAGPTGASGASISAPTLRIFGVGGSTWSRPAGCRAIWVRICAGGGGGGGCVAPGALNFASAGGGGGGGAWAEILVTSPASFYQLVCGAGGNGGSIGVSGGNGGNSNFGTLLVVGGGAAGSSGAAAVGTGQVGATGGTGGNPITLPGGIGGSGGPGMYSLVFPGQAMSGQGGFSVFSAGGIPLFVSSTLGAGQAGINGAGGSGGASGFFGIGSTGGPGGSGVCLVMEYY